MATHNFTDSQLTRAAQQLAKRHPSDNPVHNSQAMSQIAPDAQPIVAAVLASPTHAAIAAGASTSSGGGGTALNPKQNRHRGVPGQRHNIIGFATAALAAGATVGVNATSYAPFRAERVIISPYTIGTCGDSSTIAQWQVGSDSQYASNDGEPLADFAGSMSSGYVEFQEAAPSVPISANVVSTNTTSFYGAVVGVSRNRKIDPMPDRTRYARLPIKPIQVAAGATTTITATPNKPFWGQKVSLFDTNNPFGLSTTVTAGTLSASSFNMNTFQVGSDPQFMSAAQPGVTVVVPGAVFLPIYDLWIELDFADTQVPYQWNVTNIGTVSAYFGGTVHGRIPV